MHNKEMLQYYGQYAVPAVRCFLWKKYVMHCLRKARKPKKAPFIVQTTPFARLCQCMLLKRDTERQQNIQERYMPFTSTTGMKRIWDAIDSGGYLLLHDQRFARYWKNVAIIQAVVKSPQKHKRMEAELGVLAGVEMISPWKPLTRSIPFQRM